MPDIVTVPLTQGDSPALTFQITSGGDPLDLASVDVDAIIKPSVDIDDDDDTVHHLTEDDGLTISDATAGTVTLDIPAAVTEDPGWWAFRIRVTADDHTVTAVKGLLHVADS